MMALAANGEEEILVGRNATNQLEVQIGFVEPTPTPPGHVTGVNLPPTEVPKLNKPPLLSTATPSIASTWNGRS